MKTPDLWHALEGSGSIGDVIKHFSDQIAEEEEVESSRNTSQNDEAKSQVRSKFRYLWLKHEWGSQLRKMRYCNPCFNFIGIYKIRIRK